MNPIVSQKDIPPLELHMRQQFAVSKYESNAEVLHILRQKTAHMLSKKIMDDPRLFDLKIDAGYGTLRTDVIVMTVDEFFDWSHRKFKEGVQHAQGFMPRDMEI